MLYQNFLCLKGQKLENVELFEGDLKIKPTDNQILHVNSLRSEEVFNLRLVEFSKSHFNLKHLDEKDGK